jgi:capsular exopolysaccharide synthesis family protein
MDSFVELRQVVQTLLRYWWALVAGAVIAGAIGYGVSLSQKPVYSATTTVYVGRSIRAADLERTDLQLGVQLAQTYANLVRRKPVLQGAVEALQLQTSWQELKKRVDVRSVENTQLLEIRVEANSPLEAQMTADEIAHQLLLLGPISSGSGVGEENRLFAQERLARLQANIEKAEERLNELEARIPELVTNSIEQVPELQAQIQTLELLIADWDSTYANLLRYLSPESTTNHIAIVESAEASRTPVHPRVELNTLMAALVGLFLTMGLVFVKEYFDDRLKPTDVVSEILGVGTLGSINRIDGKTLPEKLILQQDPFAPASEDFRLLRNKIQILSNDWLRKIIMVTSPTPTDLKSITTANLGIVLAQAGFRVIVVDTNLRQPLQHVLFQLPAGPGLTDYLYQAKPQLNGILQPASIPGLKILTVGDVQPAHPTELLGSARMAELLNRLAEHADIVLCDSAQAVAIADALVLSAHVDAAMLVVEMGKTRRATAEQAIRNLRQGGVNVLGTVLSPVQADMLVTAPLKAPTVSGTVSTTLTT